MEGESMSHVDEGALHAYLDGALDEYPAAEARRVREHVETCAVCADRLAEERRVREEARSILDLAAPKVDVPTFEELRAYVRAGQSRRMAFGRLYKMGWAASVALALGTGWMIRGSGIDPVNTFRPTESAAPTASAERASDEAVTAAAPAAPEEADRDAQTIARAPAEPTAAEPPSVVVPERAAVDAPVGGAGSRAEVAQATPQAAAGSTAGLAPGPAPAPDLVADAIVVDARALDDTSTGRAAFGDAVSGLDSPKADAARVQERLDSAARAAESRRPVSADQTVTSALDAAAPGTPSLQRSRAANEVERERADEEEAESLVVPGLEVLSVENLGEGTAFAGTRSLQRLASGDTLEVIHLPEGVEPSLLAAPAPGRNQLVRQHVDGWLVMRAPVSLIDLEQLLERLEAGR
jgi:hypothetical protein